ncbi:MAG: hypothetical protein GF398_09205 [Chitinivibrionales bacterium]|nr:hypothetical protein [Chitinivibrionales bacterium]
MRWTCRYSATASAHKNNRSVLMVQKIAGFIAVLSCLALAGPNAAATVSIDMDATTFGASEIDASYVSAAADDQFDILVVTDGVSNLDTYTLRVVFDRTKVEFMAANLDYDLTIQNILKTNGGTVIGLSPTIRPGAGTTIDTLEAWYTLQGDDKAVAPDGFGLLATIRFKSLLGAGDSHDIRPVFADFVDSELQRDYLSAFADGTISFVPSYTLNVTSNGNGTTTPSGGVSVSHGTPQSISAAPDAGYHFVNWTVTSGAAAIDDPNSANTAVSLTSGNAEVQANFALNSYVLTVNSDGNGTTAPDGDVSVSHGIAQPVSATPGTGNHFVNWTVTNGTASIDNAGSAATQVTLVSGDATVRANFAINTYTITPVAGTGGTISPTTVQTVNHGSSVSFTIDADDASGYEIDDILVNGASVGAVAGQDQYVYAFTNVTTDQTISAVFRLKTYTLSVTADGNGTTTPASPASATHGIAQVITATPSIGYTFSHWTVESGSAVFDDANAASTSVTLTNGDATILAHFTNATYTLTLTTDGNGSVVPASPTTVTHGVPAAIEASPNSGYYFDQWTIVTGSAAIEDRYATATNATLTGSATIRADFVAAGGIDLTITGGSGNEAVFLYASSGWYGRNVATGSGVISGLKPGRYLLAVIESGKRTEFTSVSVGAGAETVESVDLRPTVQNVFAAPSVITSGGSPIVTGDANTTVRDDFDGDGDLDLLIAHADGTFDYYENTGSDLVFSIGPQSGGSDLAVAGGIACVRTADWNGDNQLDLLVLDAVSDLVLYQNNSTVGAMNYAAGTVLHNGSPDGAVGFDVGMLNGDEYPDFVFGYANGEIMAAMSGATFAWSAPVWDAIANVTLTDNSSIDAGDDAFPALIDVSGDGAADLVVGVSGGGARLYRNRGSNQFQARGDLCFNGQSLNLIGSAAISKLYGAKGDFGSVVLSDNNGSLYSAAVLLAGDFDSDDAVNVTDLAIFGDAWGLDEDAVDWRLDCNLDLSPNASNKQIIDVLDLAIFGDCWLNQK